MNNQCQSMNSPLGLGVIAGASRNPASGWGGAITGLTYANGDPGYFTRAVAFGNPAEQTNPTTDKKKLLLLCKN